MKVNNFEGVHMKFLNSKKGLFALGILAGLAIVVLAILGNPKNMAICSACFIRDTAGALKLHNAEVVQYFRPEIVGLILGATILSIGSKEFKSTGGSSPMIRFLLGVIMMIGALVFLGCPLRMILRMASGDISSYIGFIGFFLGIAVGGFFLRKGYDLGKAYPTKKMNGYVFPVIVLFLFILSLTTTIFAVSEKGPGSLHAPVIASLVVGLIVGGIAQKTRMCFGGALRNIILLKDFSLVMSICGMFVTLLIYNIVTNNFHLVAFGPIAHAQTLWNILGMFVVGFAATLAGGCPLRQLILAGSGSSDAALTVLGMFVGAALSHNLGLAAAPAVAATAEAEAVLGGPKLNGQVAIILCIIALGVIAYFGIRKEKLED